MKTYPNARTRMQLGARIFPMILYHADCLLQPYPHAFAADPGFGRSEG